MQWLKTVFKHGKVSNFLLVEETRGIYVSVVQSIVIVYKSSHEIHRTQRDYYYVSLFIRAQLFLCHKSAETLSLTLIIFKRSFLLVFSKHLKVPWRETFLFLYLILYFM